MTERDFSASVESVLNLAGWRWCHFRPARLKNGEWRTPLAGSPGLPDYIAVRGSRLIFVELKSVSGTLRAEQRQWLQDLEATGRVEVYLWRPKHWDELVETLR